MTPYNQYQSDNMVHADEDPVIHSATDDGTSGNDVRLVSKTEEDAGICVPIRQIFWQGPVPQILH